MAERTGRRGARGARPLPVDELCPENRHLDAFRGALHAWFEEARRPFPWRVAENGVRDPYRVWVSEVMLQQTRTEQAGPYFRRFMELFPTVSDLASAPLDDVLKAWEGLGYYARARNLHRAAGAVAVRHGGRIPEGDDFRALPGVGAYTAAAVQSIAFGRPLAVVDGNVVRVLTRVFAVVEDVRASATRSRLQRVADELLDPASPATHNEAMMELGATVCTPRRPRCSDCPLLGVCAAAAAGRPEDYPVVSARRPVPHVDVAVGIVVDEQGRTLVQRRGEDAMLGGLWEFPGGKVEAGETPEAACRRELAEETGLEVAVGPELASVDHAYSHFRVTIRAFRCRTVGGALRETPGQPRRWASADELRALAMPRANRLLLEGMGLVEARS